HRCPQHTFQILTKRSRRLAELSGELRWSHNVWMGVTVEDRSTEYRIAHLRDCQARVKFLSCEPLLGPLPGLPLTGIDWVIVGGESGPHARSMAPAWVREIRDRFVKAGVPYFFKQWGGPNKRATGRLLEGRVWNERPLLAHEGV
ncbi:MAG: DUF5131 family protein, partial [Deltaproteobacteria bacterium]|nr:DUF5131 family protein [Deltaproteobacteria bacterium]